MFDEDKARKTRSDVLGKLMRGFIERFAGGRVNDSERNPNNNVNFESTKSPLDASLNSGWEPRASAIDSKNVGDYYTRQQLNDKHVTDMAHATPTNSPITTASTPSPTPAIVSPTPTSMPNDDEKILTKEEIANIYAEVTPSEYMPGIDKDNPARSLTDSQLALLRLRKLMASRGDDEYTQESISPQEENEEFLNLYCEKNGIQRNISASAFPIGNSANIIDSFTREPLFDVESNDESPIDLNNIKKYPMNNVSEAMAGYQILSSHKMVQPVDVKSKF